MGKKTGTLMLVVLATAMACGTEGDPVSRAPDRARVPGGEDLVVEDPPEEPAEWNPEDWEDQVYGEGSLRVLKSGMVGQVGQHLFDDSDARALGTWYGDDSYSYSHLDTRTTLPNGKTVMVALSIDGSLLDPSLKDTQTFSLDEWGATTVFASTVGCAGQEDVWEDYDGVADETEITVTPSDLEPEAIEVSYIARWNDGYDTLEVKGVALLVPEDGYAD